MTRCAECGNDLQPETTITVTEDFKVCKSCNDDVEAGWKETKEMLRSQGIDPNNCGWHGRLVAKENMTNDEQTNAREKAAQQAVADWRQRFAGIATPQEFDALVFGFNRGLAVGLADPQPSDVALIGSEMPLCPVHKSIDETGELTLTFGNDCVACSLNERSELLELLEPFVPEGGADSVATLKRLATQSPQAGELAEAVAELAQHRLHCDCDYCIGIEKGLVATRSPWVRIESEDDLPKKSGEYEVTVYTKVPLTLRSQDLYTTSRYFYATPWGITDEESRLMEWRRANWLPASSTNWHIIAWRELSEPYRPTTGERDDR